VLFRSEEKRREEKRREEKGVRRKRRTALPYSVEDESFGCEQR